MDGSDSAAELASRFGGWLPLAQYAALNGVNYGTAWKRVRRKSIQAAKLGGTWLVRVPDAGCPPLDGQQFVAHARRTAQ